MIYECIILYEVDSMIGYIIIESIDNSMNSSTIIQILVFMCYILYLINRFRQKNVHWSIIMVIYLTWCLTFSVVIILPMDIYNVIKQDQLYNSSLQIIWNTFYWLLYFLTWGLLPVINQYLKGGEFDSQLRFQNSLYIVFIYYVKLLIPILMLLGYIDYKYN